LQDHGIGIVVMDSPRPSAAKYVIHDPDEVGRFFEEALMPMLEENA
jgi:hypothetical protein